MRRGARRELEAAKALGVARVHRGGRRIAAADMEPVALACGVVLQPECKTREAIPALLRDSLDQARRYGPPGSEPCAVISATGEEALLVLPLRVFRIVAGIAEAPPPDPQPNLFPVTKGTL